MMRAYIYEYICFLYFTKVIFEAFQPMTIKSLEHVQNQLEGKYVLPYIIHIFAY